MNITMHNTRPITIQQIKEFLEGTVTLKFSSKNKTETYPWLEQNLLEIGYKKLKKTEKGLVRKYINKVTAYSASQITNLINQFHKKARLKICKYRRHSFYKKYTDLDIKLLATIDDAHNCLAGPATKKIISREYKTFGKKEYKNLAAISVSHLYNLRQEFLYRNTVRIYHKTRPTGVPIGERRKPVPNGQPGFLRVDSVHQGDSAHEDKGVYYINLIDEVTQWEVVVCVEGISERFLIPALEMALTCFPFVIQNFHSDNGSEYINYDIVKLLNGLLIKLTKSRPRRSNDNGLAETKHNIIRKQMGYAYIPQQHAKKINVWYQQYFNIYLSYHRPCGFRKEVAVKNKPGKTKYLYPYDQYQTPYDKFKSLPNAEKYLREGVTFESLDKIAYAKSDTEFALETNEAKRKLFSTIH